MSIEFKFACKLKCEFFEVESRGLRLEQARARLASLNVYSGTVHTQGTTSTCSRGMCNKAAVQPERDRRTAKRISWKRASYGEGSAQAERDAG